MEEVLRKLDEIADKYECDGGCDVEAPYEKCPGCAACSLINELAEIAHNGLRSIEKEIKSNE